LLLLTASPRWLLLLTASPRWLLLLTATTVYIFWFSHKFVLRSFCLCY
jgi:hypothetical protein